MATINLETTGDSSTGFGYWTSAPMNYSVLSEPAYAWAVSELGDIGGYIVDKICYGVNGNVCEVNSDVMVRPVIHIYESNILEKLDVPEYVNPDDVVGAN